MHQQDTGGSPATPASSSTAGSALKSHQALQRSLDNLTHNAWSSRVRISPTRSEREDNNIQTPIQSPNRSMQINANTSDIPVANSQGQTKIQDQDASLQPDPDPTPQLDPNIDASFSPNPDRQTGEEVEDEEQMELSSGEDSEEDDNTYIALSDFDSSRAQDEEYVNDRQWRRRVLREVTRAFAKIPDQKSDEADKEVEIKHVKVLAPRHFLVIMFNSQDRDGALAGGPYYLRRRIVYTTPWEPGFDTNKVLTKKMAYWLDLANVHPLIEDEATCMLNTLGEVVRIAGVTEKQEGQQLTGRSEGKIMDLNAPAEASREKPVPDLNVEPEQSIRNQTIHQNSLEKQRRKERKKAKKKEARRRRAEKDAPGGKDTRTKENLQSDPDSDQQESSEDDPLQDSRLWQTCSKKKPKG
ncbi:hypothetical protein R1sor_013870 [Riccia sorocarpa]|uniref:Uncharacterized protein n=1 Tax=Riccia sorocarpa TaxID=122646 RepID=A0ABD3H9P0_9MARC